MKAMALDRHLRFSSCEEFAKALKQEKKVVSVKLEAKRRRARLWGSITAAVLVIAIAASVFTTVFHKKKEENTLSAANIALWFEIEDQETAEAKRNAIETVVQDFCGTYDTITVEVTGIPKDDYVSQVKNAILSNEGPVLFETTDIDVLETDCVDLSDVVKNADKQYDFYIVEEYAKSIDSYKIPLGFKTPMIFENTKKANYTDGTISHEDLIKASENGIVITTDYQKFYPSLSLSNVQPSTDKSSFFDGNSAWLLSSSTDFLTVNSQMAGKYSLVSLNIQELPCTACNCFSVAQTSDAQVKAAKKLIEYMLFPKYQDILHTEGKTSAFPVNMTAFDGYVDIYGQLETVRDKLKDYTVVE
jgi:hypothetical protein